MQASRQGNGYHTQPGRQQILTARSSAASSSSCVSCRGSPASAAASSCSCATWRAWRTAARLRLTSSSMVLICRA